MIKEVNKIQSQSAEEVMKKISAKAKEAHKVEETPTEPTPPPAVEPAAPPMKVS